MTAYAIDIGSERLLRLSEEVTRIAGALAELSMETSISSSTTETDATTHRSQNEIKVSPDTVRWLIKVRRERARYLSNELFADPAWDILLDLLHAELINHRVPISSLCIAAGVPTTTALRWISNMVKQGLLTRRSDPHDGRRVYVELAPNVSVALRQYFADIIEPGSRVWRP